MNIEADRTAKKLTRNAKMKFKKLASEDGGNYRLFFNSAFTREDGASIPRAEEMEAVEIRGVCFTRTKVRKI